MVNRLWFPFVALFWVIMNVLLWRSEVSATRVEGSPVPVETVWERILTAPDDSTLEIHRRGHKIGWCRWVPKVEEGMPTTPAPGPGTGGELPEGQVTRVSGYSISLDGNVSLEDPAERVRFTGRVDFDVRREWQALFVRVTLRPNTFELRADAAQQTVSFRMGDQPGAWEQTFSFDQLAQPEAVLAAFGVPLPTGWMQTLLPGAAGRGGSSLSLGLNWEARQSWLSVGSARARTFRVAARLLDRHEAVAMISRVGEILRLELPGGVTLISEALVGF